MNIRINTSYLNLSGRSFIGGIVCLIFIYSAPSFAAQVTLAWDTSKSACDGYHLFMRDSGQAYDYSSPVWSGTATTCTISQLEEGTYYFVARAYKEDIESINSNEVEYKVTVYPDNSSATDSDGDGLSDEDEINVYGTSPYDADTDGDGVQDGQEVADGTDPTAVDDFGQDTHIWIEAEAGHLGAPMIENSDGSAAAGMAIGVPNGTGSFSSPDSAAGYAEFPFEIQASGTYFIWGRVLAPTKKDDSFFIAMDSGEFVRWNTQRGNQWIWDQIGTRSQDPMTFDLQPGEHTLYIMQREDGTYLDKILITGNAAFIPEGKGPVVDTPVTHYEVEAESGILSGPFQISDDAGASGSRFVLAPNGVGTFLTASESAGLVEYPFSLSEEGDYVIWGRVRASSGKDNSFYVAIDDTAFTRWNTILGDQWTWDQVNAHQGDDPVTYHLEPGTHRLYIMQREDGTCIDKLIVTKKLDFLPDQ
jgi:hypothetical protein